MENVKRVDMKFNNRNKGRRKDVPLFAIYPDYWKKAWGNPPRLGLVRAEDSFSAVRKAELLGIYHRNLTFEPMAVQVKHGRVFLNRRVLYNE